MTDNAERTVLIVDDDADVLDAMRRSLFREGYRLLKLNDPHQALALLQSDERVDLLLSDIDMPGLSGLDLMRTARQLRPSMVRVLITGKGTADVVTRAINEGEVHRFLHKPFDPDELRRVVAAGLERQAELGVASDAARRAEARHRIREELERRYPGITTVARDESRAYRLDLEEARRVAKQMRLTAMTRGVA